MSTALEPHRLRTSRAMLAIGVTFAVYVVTVASHLGEFFPFSIYPMFSQAGKPWTRALMVEVEPSTSDAWGPWTLQDLPGAPFVNDSIGVNTNDLSKFIQLTDDWTDERVATLRKLYAPALADGRSLLLLRGQGKLVGEDEVAIAMTGLIRIDPEQSVVNPALK